MTLTLRTGLHVQNIYAVVTVHSLRQLTSNPAASAAQGEIMEGSVFRCATSEGGTFAAKSGFCMNVALLSNARNSPAENVNNPDVHINMLMIIHHFRPSQQFQ